jgi:phosphoribosyl 1,2-cyclic phosphate phosphodiesterase
MTITFLGTGTSQGVPVIGCDCPVCRSVDFRDKRLRVSVHVEVAGKRFVIDTGPDFRQQVLRERIRQLDAVLFTHEHKDHTAGLDDVRSYNFLQGRDMPVYARPAVLDQLRREFAYVFAEKKYPGVPRLQLHEIQNAPFTVEGVPITPIEVWHLRLPVYGFRIGDFTYITDANRIEASELEKIRGTKVLVLNALQQSAHPSHFTLAEALEIVNRIQPEQAYFTHLSHKMGLHREVEAQLPKHVRLGFDGLKFSV